MSDNSSTDDGFVARVHDIEERPLDERAAAYAGLQDELARRLESGVPTAADESAA